MKEILAVSPEHLNRQADTIIRTAWKLAIKHHPQARMWFDRSSIPEGFVLHTGDVAYDDLSHLLSTDADLQTVPSLIIPHAGERDRPSRTLADVYTQPDDDTARWAGAVLLKSIDGGKV